MRSSTLIAPLVMGVLLIPSAFASPLDRALHKYGADTPKAKPAQPKASPRGTSGTPVKRRRRRRKMPFLLQAGGMGAYSISTAVEGAAPTLLQFMGELDFSIHLTGRWFVGAGTDFRFINQYSDTSTAAGNRRGTYFSIVRPSLTYRGRNWQTRISVRFLGTYDLKNKTLTGDTVSYTGALGGSVSPTFKIWKGLFLGATLEWLHFGTQKTDGQELPGAGSLDLVQIGASGTYEFQIR